MSSLDAAACDMLVREKSPRFEEKYNVHRTGEKISAMIASTVVMGCWLPVLGGEICRSLQEEETSEEI